MTYKDATLDQVELALKEAQIAFLSYKNLSGKKKADFYALLPLKLNC